MTSTPPKISAIICTHRPRPDYLKRVLDALEAQNLPREQWELILVDNGSVPPVQADLSWHPRGRIIRDEVLGLTHARIAGFRESSADLIVYIDDDNVLNPDYLTNALAIHNAHPDVGAFGGISTGEWEVEPPDWFSQINTGILACRNMGPNVIINGYDSGMAGTYPVGSPSGAGMVLLRRVMDVYTEKLASDPRHLALGRKGGALTSGEDNDIVFCALEDGLKVGYFPSLGLTHLIPESRLKLEYLGRLQQGIHRSWVLMLALHGIVPWKPIPRWSLPLRKFRAWLRLQPWRSTYRWMEWRGACGRFEGQAALGDLLAKQTAVRAPESSPCQ